MYLSNNYKNNDSEHMNKQIYTDKATLRVIGVWGLGVGVLRMVVKDSITSPLTIYSLTLWSQVRE